MDLKLNNRFDGNIIKITRIRETNDWHGNAVHFQYNGQTYRASIYDEGQDEDGVEMRYAHLQIADNFGNWGTDIAKKDDEDEILISLKDFAEKARNRMIMIKSYGGKYFGWDEQQKYNRSIPYKFYDNNAFADYLNSVFVG
jgi:hypothetical protein